MCKQSGIKAKRRKKMNCYETLFILKPTLTEEETAKQVELVQNYVTDAGGDIAATDSMGMRKLAYEIDGNARGYYTIIYHKSPAAAIAEIERRLRYNEDVLKFLTIKYSNKKEIAHFEKLVAACSSKKEEESASEEA